ncbi:putative C2H2 finger domain protein [Aspergillus lucknowensis]|uniref:C2H2-type domain-containing protein n=1 Tax=Aspergillus lucknowensis TaxID=176173 RepID=A0ABR4LZI0_9EURO
MSGPHFAWDGTSDVLQGITPTPSQAELSPSGPPSSDPTPGDPASFLGFQFGPFYNHPPVNQYLPPPKQSASPTPQPLDYSHYQSARFMSNQDSWNPLQVTGLPANVSFVTRPMGRPHQTGGFDRRCSTDQYSTASENGSQYNGIHASDSGYSTRSWTTRSIAASYVVDSACSPNLGPQDYEQDEKVLPLDISSTHNGDSMDVADHPESPPLLCHEAIKCEYPNCTWTGKCPSDKRKHEARHKKLFKCDEPNCTRKEGFGTINDLARHKKCVHKKEPERGPKVLYMCFGHNCPRSNKKWPRLDNFRQHLARMHNNEDMDALLRKSHDWYENCVKPHDMAPTFTDTLSDGATPCQTQQIIEPENLAQDLDQEIQDPIAPVHTAFQSSNMLTLESIKRLDEEHEMHGVEHFPPQTAELSALETLDFEPALEQKMCNPSQLVNNRNDKMDDMISEAAVSVINAMTKMINNHQRRRGQLGDDDMKEQGGELSDRNRELLQKILFAASGLLSESSGPDNGGWQNSTGAGSDKPGWIQCEFCPKQTRLRCEMKKHKKRHERPYGCTFHKCDKTFGSKADWKRHEQSQHFGIQSWQCTLPDPAQQGVLCALTFIRREAYTQHLKDGHQVDDKEIQASVCKNRLGWSGEAQFWCGFCRDIIHLQEDGLVAWNQRFDHIDTEHFKKGERIEDWFFPLDRVTKGQDLEEIAHGPRDMQADGKLILDDHSDVESVCSSHSGHMNVREDDMVVDRESSEEPLSSTPHGGLGLQGTSQFQQANQRKRKLRTAHLTQETAHSTESGMAAVEKKPRTQTPISMEYPHSTAGRYSWPEKVTHEANTFRSWSHRRD